MADQRAKSGKGKGPFRLWVEQNQKVIWVVLLIIIAPLFAFTGPVTNFFDSGMEDRVEEEFYGKEIMRSDLVKVEPRLGAALVLSNLANSTAMFSDPTSPLPAPIFQGDSLLSDGRGSDEFDIYRYFLYKEKARRMGLRVTDRELSDHIRDLWQWLEASKRASEEISKKYADQKKDTKAPDQQQQFLRQREATELARRIKKDFENLNAWDPSSWASFVTSIGRRSSSDRPRLRDLEEVLRDLYLIAKLENHVRNGVQVTPDEVYAKYREENRTRLFSWTGFTVSEALKEKVSASLKPEELKLHYDSNREKFEKPFSIRAAWLLLPREHFRAEAEKVMTDADVVKHYEEHRNEYRRPTISSQESSFSVRTQEESAKLAAALYKPFEEVKDDVRKKAIDARADTDMRAFSQKLHPRLWPNSPPGSPPPAPPTSGLLQGTSKEFPFLQYETSGWATLDDAEKVFGKGFSRQVTSWINQIASQRPGQPMDLKAPPTAIEGGAGLIYYAKPELRPPTVPPLADLKDEVQASAVLARGVELIEKSARAEASEIEAGKKTLEQVAEAGLDVNVGPEASPEKVHIAGSPVQRSPRHLGRYGPLMIPKAKKDGETKPDEAKKDEPAKPEADPEEPEEEAHPSSRQILDGATRISEKGKTTTVNDAEEGSCYIVRLDDALSPDASNFEDRRSLIESQLLREKQGQRLTQWKAEVLLEARGSMEPAPSGEAKTAPPTP